MLRPIGAAEPVGVQTSQIKLQLLSRRRDDASSDDAFADVAARTKRELSDRQRSRLTRRDSLAFFYLFARDHDDAVLFRFTPMASAPDGFPTT